jgi:hypothetical protein
MGLARAKDQVVGIFNMLLGSILVVSGQFRSFNSQKKHETFAFVLMIAQYLLKYTSFRKNTVLSILVDKISHN